MSICEPPLFAGSPQSTTHDVWRDRRKQRDRELDWLVDQAVQAGMPLDAALRERDFRTAEDLRLLLLTRYNDLKLSYWRERET